MEATFPTIKLRHVLFASAPRHFSNSAWFRAAAIVLIAAGLFLLKTRKAVTPSSVGPTYTSIFAPNGTKKHLTLSDSTEVYLNSGSVIRIASDFGNKDRKVELTGEAYFLVKHNALKPFTINSGKLLITDVGTSFNVSAYPGDEKIKVAVESGIVKIQANSNENETFANALTLNQQFTYNTQNHNHDIKQVRVSDLLAWKNNQLRFDNASFEEIAARLERWYNVTIALHQQTASTRRYTVSFNNEPLAHVLEVFKDLSGMSYKIKGNNVSINLKN
jgi:ferric-dicitrate binding protein FerR (iron transport regulator)